MRAPKRSRRVRILRDLVFCVATRQRLPVSPHDVGLVSWLQTFFQDLRRTIAAMLDLSTENILANFPYPYPSDACMLRIKATVTSSSLAADLVWVPVSQAPIAAACRWFWPLVTYSKLLGILFSLSMSLWLTSRTEGPRKASATNLCTVGRQAFPSLSVILICRYPRFCLKGVKTLDRFPFRTLPWFDTS